MNYDLLAFNEVWNVKHYENLKVVGFEIKGMKLRQLGRGGGTLIFGRTSILTTTLETPFIEGCIETSGVKIGDINFINVYRAPNGNKQEFFNLITNYLDTLMGQNIVLGGDFNLDSNKDNKWINL